MCLIQPASIEVGGMLRWVFMIGMGVAFGAPMAAQSLSDAVDAAYNQNPQLSAQRQVTAQAQEQISQARGQRRPSVSASGSLGFESIDSNRPFGVETGERAVTQAQVQASLPVYTGGAIAAGIRQAEAGYRAAQADFDGVLQTLILDTITAYMDVYRDRETITIRRNSVELLAQQLQAAQDRFDVGVVTRTDVAQSEARLEGARAALAGAQASLEASNASFVVLVGAYPADLESDVAIPVLFETIELATEAALRHSPELMSARESERAAIEAIAVAESALKPSVAIVGTAVAQETYDENFRDTNVSAVVQGSVPLFQGGVLKSQVRSARLQRDQARFQIDNATRQIQAQVAQAWFGHLAALKAIEASERQVEAAQIAFQGAQEELAVGVRTTLDVLDQEQQLLDARLSRVEAGRDAVVSAYQLLRVTGQLDRSRIGSESP